MELQGSNVKKLSKKSKKKMQKQLDVMEETREEKSNLLQEKILQNRENYLEQQKALDEMESKLIKQIEDLRRRKLLLAGALSALNKLLEEDK